MKIETWQIERVIPYARNPRINDQAVAGVAASIKEFGWQQPIIVDREGVIVAGHTRHKAALQLGLNEVPVHVADNLTPQQIKAYRILDNKLGEKAEWNTELLAAELEDLPEFDFAGYEVEFDGTEVEPNTTEDEVPETSESDPISQLGDVWLCGRHRVYCGDCGEISHGIKAKLMFTSPPYSDMRTYEGCSLSISDLAKCFNSACDLYAVNLGLKFKSSEVVQYWDDWILEARKQNLKLLAWNVWNKMGTGSVASATNMFSLVHEFIFCFGLDAFKLNRTIPNNIEAYERRHGKDFLRRGTNTGKRQQDGSISSSHSVTYTHHQLESVVSLFYECSNLRKDHPAVYPVGLPMSYIEAATDENETVFDPFLGSGTTLIACERLNRICYGCEIAPKYVDVICRRFYNETGIIPRLESTGEEFPIDVKP